MSALHEKQLQWQMSFEVCRSLTRYNGPVEKGTKVSTGHGVHAGCIIQSFKLLDILVHLLRVRNVDIEPSPIGITEDLELAGHLKKVCLAPRPTSYSIVLSSET